MCLASRYNREMFKSLIFFALVLFSYISGVSSSVYGGDSGDIILASWFGGVAHPPGYPLNTILGWIFTHLPLAGPVAYKANLLAAFLQASNVLVLLLILKKITRNYIASILGALVLAFNPLFLLYAHILEVFQLNILLLGFSILFLLSWKEQFALSKGKSKKHLYLFFLFWGLAVFHHHTSVLLAPASIYFIYKMAGKTVLKSQFLLKAGAFFLMGIFPYIFIPFAAMRETPINWNNPQTLENFIRLITRADYGTFTAAGFLLSTTLTQKGLQLLQFLLFIKADFLILGVLIAVLGAFYSFLKERIYFWFIFLAFLFSGPFFLVYAGFPISTDFYTGLWERFLLTSYFFVTFFIGFGFKFIIEKFIPFLSNRINFSFFRKKYTLLLLTLCLFLYTFALFLINVPKTDLSKFYLGDWLGYDVLNSAEPNSIVFVVGDTALFNSQYVRYTNKNYQDRMLIKAGSLAFLEYRQQVIREYPQLNFPDQFLTPETHDGSHFMQILVEANYEKYSVYIRDFSPKVPGFKWINVGLLKKFTKEGEISVDEAKNLNNAVFEKFMYKDSNINLGYSQFITSHLKEHYYSAYIELSNMFLEFGDNGSALFYADKAKKLLPDKKDAYIISGNIYGSLGQCDESADNFENILKIDEKDWKVFDALYDLYVQCYKDVQNAGKFKIQSDLLRPKSKFELNEF